MATLENTVLILAARKSDLAARESVLLAQENIQRLLGEFEATTLDGALAKIESDLAHREEVFKVLEQLSVPPDQLGRTTSPCSVLRPEELGVMRADSCT